MVPRKPRIYRALEIKGDKERQENGAGDRNRTCDLLITNELLYRLSYTGQGLLCSKTAGQRQGACSGRFLQGP